MLHCGLGGIVEVGGAWQQPGRLAWLSTTYLFPSLGPTSIQCHLLAQAPRPRSPREHRAGLLLVAQEKATPAEGPGSGPPGLRAGLYLSRLFPPPAGSPAWPTFLGYLGLVLCPAGLMTTGKFCRGDKGGGWPGAARQGLSFTLKELIPERVDSQPWAPWSPLNLAAAVAVPGLSCTLMGSL